jgi:coenzyme F420-0:L-glutamate ligase / coenzyme F420-1:gamma-L-glutamate ligase
MQMDEARLEAWPLPAIPEIEHGADLGALIVEAAGLAAIELSAGDVVVVAQKAVSKAEGRLRALSSVEPTKRATAMAERLAKDPRLVQVILDESAEVLRAERGVIVTRTRHGVVCANAGVDASNIPDEDVVSLLPEDPDRSARELRSALRELLSHAPAVAAVAAVVISDSFGRPWRLGQSEVAIGCAGLLPLDDLRGSSDAHGRPLVASVVAIADEAAAAAGLVRRKSGREAVVVVRGLDRYVIEEDGPGARAIVRPESEDLFR